MSWLSKSVKKPLDKVAAVVNPSSILPSLLTKGHTGTLDMSAIQAAIGAAAYGGMAMMPGAAGGGATAASGAGLSSAGAASAAGSGGFMSAFGRGLGGALPFLGMAGASMYGANQGADAQRDANQANIDLAREQMLFSAGQAQREMDFQERMSGSSYQRAVEDMRKAGINPMLAIGNGGASTPTGAMGSGSAAHVDAVPSVVANAITSSMDMIRSFAGARQAMATARSAEASVPNFEAKTLEAIQNAKKIGADTSAVELHNKRAAMENEVYGANSESMKRIGNFFWGTMDAITKRLQPWTNSKDVERDTGVKWSIGR